MDEFDEDEFKSSPSGIHSRPKSKLNSSVGCLNGL